ncbi:phosphatidate cytidylyltransferase [Halopseudomonas pelagia]|uniref:Phosphatidate cytidylyltransferase n=1 Tax=Halopseudomonas pelagia TaxID=553151 RepID=A0AA91U061_9GAMM|nr:phosphatidate cytidylyltransferase [Halopseudomonas pelagia]PCC98083.1 phosphatidate cytidylyltransferase [Halopseudomonas pelagia]QFY56051.1 phosphatidate cytidylyltransferase [Halopseudomonas pelagia]
MLKQRIITAVILAPLAIAGFVLLEGPWFALFVGAVVVLGAWEWARLAGETAQKGRVLYALVVALMMFALYRLGLPVHYLLIPAAVWWVLAAVMVVRYPRDKGLWASCMVAQLLGLLILLPAWAGLVWLREVPNGLWLIVALLVLVWAADIGAYFAGKTWGRRKLMPNVSPGKTIEGFLGGLVFTQLLTLLALLYLGWSLSSLLIGLFGAALVVTFSVVGDLTESLFKRDQGLKDSSNLLPGHGGVLDRIDSLTAAIPVFALFWLLIGSQVG